MESILLHTITPEEFFGRLRAIIKEEVKIEFQQDQLLTKEGALKMLGISNATFTKAINEGIVKPQLVKGRKKAIVWCNFESHMAKTRNRFLSRGFLRGLFGYFSKC